MQDEKYSRNTEDADLLVSAAIEGDADAFGRLYDLYVARVYRHIYYRVGNVKDAEDLTQQVFLKAWQAIGKFRKTASPFPAWLMRIGHNLVIDFYRSRKDTTYLDMEDTFAGSSAGPAQLAEESIDRQEIRKAILQLPGDQQQVVMMSFIEGFSYGEIAAAMGKKEGNIRVIMHRALKRLRKIMDTEKFTK